MKRYTVYNTQTSQPEAEGRPWPTADGVSQPVGMPPELVLLEEQNGADPAFDPATHKLGGWGARFYDTNAGTATRTKEVVALTADEIAAANRKASRDALAETWHALPPYIRANYSHLYQVCNAWLDAGEDELALTIVQDAEPLQSIAAAPSKIATFQAVKAQMVAAIQAL